MNLELAAERYNRLPEASYRDTRYIDLSHWADGERTRRAAQRDLGRRTARATFSALPSNIRDREFIDRPVTILFPGTLIPASATFREQLPVIEDSSKPVLLDYSDRRFSQEILRSQVVDFIESPPVNGRDVNLIGFSFGAANVIDLLSHEPSVRERIRRVILMGALFSSHDLKNSLGYRVVKALHPVVREGTLWPVVPLLRRRVKVNDDPMLLGQEGGIHGSKAAVSHKAFAERAASVVSRDPIETLGQITDIPTLFFYWENDESDPGRRLVLAKAFPNSETVHVSGNHGHTISESHEINPEIGRFLEPSHEELLAAA
ncbi:MAG: hypothetical protein HYW63_03075 [Candidatus Levybacteria bacterium]|nr:hypothetical protein [Candidatus Levybacteria bacterium]